MDDLFINLSYTTIINANARVTYRASKQLNFYTAFEWLNEAYYLAERTVSNERIMEYEKRLVGGARWNFWSHGMVDFNGGYAFDRYYGEGTSSASNNLTTGVDLAPGAFIGTNLMFHW